MNLRFNEGERRKRGWEEGNRTGPPGGGLPGAPLLRWPPPRSPTQVTRHARPDLPQFLGFQVQSLARMVSDKGHQPHSRAAWKDRMGAPPRPPHLSSGPGGRVQSLLGKSPGVSVSRNAPSRQGRRDRGGMDRQTHEHQPQRGVLCKYKWTN